MIEVAIDKEPHSFLEELYFEFDKFRVFSIKTIRDAVVKAVSEWYIWTIDTIGAWRDGNMAHVDVKFYDVEKPLKLDIGPILNWEREH